MSEDQVDSLERLEIAIKEWQQQLAQDHQEMIDQIARTRHQVEERMEQVRAELEALRAASADGSPRETPPVPITPPDEVRGKLELSVFDENGHRRRMGEILISAGIISETQLHEALTAQSGTPQRRLGDILVEMGYTGEDVIAQVLASQLNLPFVRLSKASLDAETVRLVSPKLARMHHCIPLRATEGELVLAMSNPLDLIAIDDVELATSRRVTVAVATTGDITEAIETHYLNTGNVWF